MLTSFVFGLALTGASLSLGEPVARLSDDGHFRVIAQSELAPVPINRMHRWTIAVADADGAPVTDARITIDGGMPAHDHGLPTAPRVTRNFNDGSYLIEGMKFHMNGQWQLTVTVEAGSHRDAVTFELVL